MKLCKGCSETKDESAFGKNAFYCKECNRARGKARYAARKEEVRQGRLAIYQGGLKQCKSCGKFKSTTEYIPHLTHWDRLSHVCKDCANAQMREKYKQNPEANHEKGKRWYRNNRQRKLDKNKEWRQTHQEESRAIWHRYQERKRNNGGEFLAYQWKLIKEYYAPGNLCPCCGRKAKMTIDHVIPVIMGGYNFIDNIQPLCKSCNSSKGDKRTDDYRPDQGCYAAALRALREMEP